MMVGLSAAACACITTPLGYSGAIFTAVWRAEVVAPPTMTGTVMPRCCSSLSVRVISSKEGVMSPLSPITAAWCSMAALTMVSLSTITPRSMTL